MKHVSFVAQTPVHNLGKPNVKLLFTQVEALSVFAALIGAILASRLVDTVHIVHIKYLLLVAEGKKEDLLDLDLKAV